MKVSYGLDLVDLEFGLVLLPLIVFSDLIDIIPEEPETSPLSDESLDLFMITGAFLRGERDLRLLMLAGVGRERARIFKFLTTINSC